MVSRVALGGQYSLVQCQGIPSSIRQLVIPAQVRGLITSSVTDSALDTPATDLTGDFCGEVPDRALLATGRIISSTRDMQCKKGGGGERDDTDNTASERAAADAPEISRPYDAPTEQASTRPTQGRREERSRNTNEAHAASRV